MSNITVRQLLKIVVEAQELDNRVAVLAKLVVEQPNYSVANMEALQKAVEARNEFLDKTLCQV